MRRPVLRRSALTLLAALALLAAGCGGSSHDDGEESTPPAPAPQAVPQAKTEPEWIRRLVTRFLRPMNKNLAVVNSLGTPQVRLYLRTGNETTIRVLRTRMTDLSGCSRKLQRVGSPPTQSGPLVRIYTSLQRACPHYELLAQTVLRSIPLLGSRNATNAARGEEELAKAYEPSRAAARHYVTAVQIIERNGLLNSYEG
jgi:hypothetical protein